MNVTVFRRMCWVLLSLLLAACSGRPSDSEAERLFAEQNKQLGFAELFDFENVKRVVDDNYLGRSTTTILAG